MTLTSLTPSAGGTVNPGYSIIFSGSIWAGDKKIRKLFHHKFSCTCTSKKIRFQIHTSISKILIGYNLLLVHCSEFSSGKWNVSYSIADINVHVNAESIIHWLVYLDRGAVRVFLHLPSFHLLLTLLQKTKTIIIRDSNKEIDLNCFFPKSMKIAQIFFC